MLTRSVGTHSLGQNDTAPSLAATLVFPPGTSATVLVGATVTIDVWTEGALVPVVTNGACVIVDAALYKVRFDWLPAHTATAGMLHARFLVVAADGKRFTIPNDKSVILVEIQPAKD